jgi:hypothetical protein
MKALKPSVYVRILMTCKKPQTRQNVLSAINAVPVGGRFAAK